MKKIPVQKIRLAAKGDRAPDVYNCYQLWSQLSGLYFKGAEVEKGGVFQTEWQEASDLMIEDMGYFVDFLKQVTMTDLESLDGSAKALARSQSAGRLALRLVSLDAQLTLWYPKSRWVRIILLAERKSSRFLKEIARAYSVDGKSMQQLLSAAARRQEVMTKLFQRVEEDEKSIDENFAIPVAL